MNSIQLKTSLSACPTCWINFIKSFNTTYQPSVPHEAHFNAVNEELMHSFNAYVSGDQWSSYEQSIVFMTEEDMINFMLKWS